MRMITRIKWRALVASLFTIAVALGFGLFVALITAIENCRWGLC
jgi:flagellar biosynthesis protein FliQ